MQPCRKDTTRRRAGLPSVPYAALGEDEASGIIAILRASKSLAWTGLGKFQARPGGIFPRGAYLRDAQVVTSPEGEVDLAAAVFETWQEQAERKLPVALWFAHGKIRERLQERGTLPVDLAGRTFHLARSSDGAVYACAVAPCAAHKDRPQIHLWRVSGEFPPRAIPNPWFGLPFGILRATFLDARRVAIAWGIGDQVFVQDFTVPES